MGAVRGGMEGGFVCVFVGNAVGQGFGGKSEFGRERSWRGNASRCWKVATENYCIDVLLNKRT